MAKIALIGIEPSTARHLVSALDGSFHQIIQKSDSCPPADVADCDIVFANGEGRKYMPLLRGVRQMKPSLPFVVVTRIPDTSDWLDALEAGATDYCSAPFEHRQMNWLIQSAMPRTAAAA